MVLLRLNSLVFGFSCLILGSSLSFAQTADISSGEATVTLLPSKLFAVNKLPYVGQYSFAPGQAQPTGQAQAPAAKPGAPSLDDLGFPADQVQSNAKDQARLDKRSHMLKMHQRLGLITTVPLVLTLFSGGLAGGHGTSSGGRNFHAALGTTTVGLYATTAYFAIAAPKFAGTPVRGPIRLHKTLAWVHGSGMILTSVLGAMAYNQKQNGQKVHGIASAHGAVGGITAVAYGLAIASVSLKF